MEEIWKDIKGYEGIYQISNLGNVKSLERKIWNGRGFYTSKESKMKINKNGEYWTVNLSRENTDKQFKIHRLVAETFIPNPDNKPQVNHIDGNKFNNNIKNLEWVTASENIRHAYNLGLKKIKTGEEHHLFGTKCSNETKMKISCKNKGRISPMKGKFGNNNPMYGRKHTEESKIKMRENHKYLRGGDNPNARKVICVTTNEIFDSIQQASEKYNIKPPNITRCCNGGRKSAGKHPNTGEKLIWMYKNETLLRQK